MKTVDFLDALKRQHHISSDYALAQQLGVSRQKVSNYRRGADTFGGETAIKVAALGNWPIGYVLACIEEERAERTKRTAVMKAWREVAKALAPFLMGVAVGVGALLNPTLSRAGSAPVNIINHDIHSTTRRVLRRLARLLAALAACTTWSTATAGEFNGFVMLSAYPYHNEYDPSPNVPFEHRTVARYAFETELTYQHQRAAVFVETHSYFGDSRPQTAYNLNGPHIETYVVKGIGYDVAPDWQLQIASGEHYGGSRYRGEQRQWAALRLKVKF